MKTIKYLLTIFLLLLILDFLSNNLLSHFYKENKIGQSGGKINNLLTHYDSVNILVVGNSRAAHHIDPSILGKNNFNLSHNGMGLDFQVGIVNLILNSKIKIDTILFHIEEYEIVTNTPTTDITYLKYYYDQNEYIRYHINKIDKYAFIKNISKSYKFNGKILSTIKNYINTKQNSYYPINGYIEKTENDTLLIEKQLKTKNKEPNRLIINNKSKEYLLSLIELCKLNNIKLIIFQSPTLYKTKQSAVLKNFFLNNNTIYFDYYHNEIKDINNIKNWIDPTHLNNKGAKIITNELRKDINEYPI
ncbi:hypothetical protein MY04_1056 [Flammeovirga sp. MY04]|uniref:hypothetical protein n=1 Tax=Flammeovirga sp. MY04 TaxID=1191459 RepID=UPI00080635D5|nr:hypothetical protein [Flammeovirga sp. MY04]ANQ48434.1 hypothetical protein MY04_1056 [Flammeovirga sp. MY04]